MVYGIGFGMGFGMGCVLSQVVVERLCIISLMQTAQVASSGDFGV